MTTTTATARTGKERKTDFLATFSIFSHDCAWLLPSGFHVHAQRPDGRIDLFKMEMWIGI
jgi:hypothetical protein